jgi:CRP/FNR family transcriptional regulator, cyclic AMP receptor protein
MIEPLFLSKMRLFANLDVPALERVAALLVEREYHRGEVVFRQGESGEAIFFLREGKIKISRLETDGREHIVHFFEPGNGFGLVVALDGQPYPSTATSVSYSRVWRMLTADYRQLLVDIPNLNTMGVISSNLREAQDRAQSLAVQNLHGRLARFLLSQAARTGRRRGDLMVLPLDLTQEEMAGLMGAARESVSRIMAELRREGVVQEDAGGNLLLDEARLAAWGKGKN